MSIKIQTQITILKLIKLEPKKKKSKANLSEPRWGGGYVVVGQGQTDDLYVRERAPAEVLLEKKRKKLCVRESSS